MSVPGSPSATRQPDGIARKNTSALIQPDDFESLFTNTELRQQLGTLAYPANATTVSVVPRQTRYQTPPVVRNTENKWYLDLPSLHLPKTVCVQPYIESSSPLFLTTSQNSSLATLGSYHYHGSLHLELRIALSQSSTRFLLAYALKLHLLSHPLLVCTHFLLPLVTSLTLLSLLMSHFTTARHLSRKSPKMTDSSPTPS